MNQILAVNKNNNKGNGKKIEIVGAVKIFAIAILVFGIIIIGIVGVSIFKNSAKKSIPQASINQVENKVEIKITHDKTIDRVLYKWNSDQESVLYGMGRTEMDEKIDLIEGTNTLYVKIIDAEGNEVVYDKQFVVEGVDLTKPEIEMILEGVDLKIVAKDNEEMKELRYSINDGEEVVEKATGEDKTKIATSVAIEKGESTVKITAIDINGNEQVKEQTFKGATKPKIEFFKDGGTLIVKITDEEMIKNMECVLNEQTYTKDVNDKVIEFKCPLIEGVNIIKIKAENSSGLVAEAEGTCEYTP